MWSHKEKAWLLHCTKMNLFGQVSTLTGSYQLPIFRCTIVHPWRFARHNFGVRYIDEFMSYNSLTTFSQQGLNQFCYFLQFSFQYSTLQTQRKYSTNWQKDKTHRWWQWRGWEHPVPETWIRIIQILKPGLAENVSTFAPTVSGKLEIATNSGNIRSARTTCPSPTTRASTGTRASNGTRPSANLVSKF